ncbi:MAG: [protein-PII] uridylyltransferase [Rhodospirillaceae bacterium]|nr:[protein-PII] uridylyltransferase [Rhodospirillaceae bacterium]
MPPTPDEAERILDVEALSARLAALAGTHSPGDPGLSAALVGELRRAFTDGEAEIRRRFLRDPKPADTCVRERAWLADTAVRLIADVTWTRLKPGADGLAILAVGGYGYGRLAPQSDLDLLFLLGNGQRGEAEPAVEAMLYLLWDLGARIGHGVRTVEECIRGARTDMTIRTNLLDLRPLWGDATLTDELARRLQRDVIRGTGHAFVEAKLAERAERHSRWGTSRFVLEPNIKEGKGGLRDLQTLRWLGRYLYEATDLKGLIDAGVLTRQEADRFRRTESHLWTLRCHLHYLTGRAEERLTFDLQTKIAQLTGYADRNGAMGVERFMKHYFLTAKHVGDLTRVVCAALEAESQRPPRRPFRLFQRRSQPSGLDGFAVERERLTVTADDQFVEQPIDMIRLFRVAQVHDLDIHPKALKLISQSHALIHGLRKDPEANHLFMDILTAREDPETALRRMNGAGVLGRFIPDFGRVVAQMQYDMYHVYTVDEHTLFAVGMLHRIETGQDADRFPLATRLFGKIAHRRALYVAMFLHDVAKGRGGDHSELGKRIALRLGPRLGLDEEETELAAWLVEQHLVMSKVALNRDIEDDKTVMDFVHTVATRERLRLLTVLTTADIAAVGPGRWNAWKGTILGQLYDRASALMTGGFDMKPVAARIERAKSAVREELADWTTEEQDAFLVRGYPAYWLSLDAETHARHARLLRQRELDGQEPVIDTRIDRGRAITEITVVTDDHHGLFGELAGALALSGATIVDARIYTLMDGNAVDIFAVQDAVQGGVFDAPDKLARMSVQIERALSGILNPSKELAHRRPVHPPRARVFRTHPAVTFDNTVSETHTVIEIMASDRPGLLSDVADALNQQGVQISSARIATFGVRAVDVFYVKDIYGVKITHPTKLADVQAQLLDALAAPAVV